MAARQRLWRRQERVGGWVFSRSGHWRALSRSGLWRIGRPVQQSQMYNQLTLSRGAGGSIPRSHCPRLAPSWWALLPALEPGLRGWAQLPGRSSSQSLGFVLARRSQREMVLHHRWARADALHCWEMVGWALGQEGIWRDHPKGRRRGANLFFFTG